MHSLPKVVIIPFPKYFDGSLRIYFISCLIVLSEEISSILVFKRVSGDSKIIATIFPETAATEY